VTEAREADNHLHFRGSFDTDVDGPLNSSSDNISADSEDSSPDRDPTLIPAGQRTDPVEETLVPNSAEAASTLAGKSFGDYELLDEIARGGMGVVYRARHKSLNRVVALKTMLSGQLASAEEQARFLIEANAAARLDHPGIVPVYEIGTEWGRQYFSMKYIGGGSLTDRMSELRSDPRRIAALMIQVCRALEHAHQRGVLHRDMKPANILLNDDGAPMLTDFGLARAGDADSRLTQTGAVMGTPSYMSPEQASGARDVTTATDIYAVGAILYELLAGRPPFTGKNTVDTLMHVVEGNIPTFSSLQLEADPQLELIARKCLSRLPESRYSSSGSVADDLQAWLDGRPISVSPPSVTTVAFSWLQTNARSAIAAMTVGAVGGLVVGLLFAMVGMRVAPMEQLYEHFPERAPAVLSLFSWLSIVPASARQWLQFPLFAVVAILGLINFQVVRPASRDVALATGTLAGLFAAGVSFLVSLGWQPLTTLSVDAGQQDIQILSIGMLSESETEQALAQRALIRRYPILNDVRADARAGLIAGKIQADQTLGIPAGLWVGLSLSAFLITVPVVVGTMLAGRMTERFDNFWQAFGRFAEAMPLFCVSLMLILFFVFPQISILPSPWARALFLGALLATSAAAVLDVRLVFRLLLHFSWITAMVLYHLGVANVVRGPQNAAVAAADGDYELAAQSVEELLAQKPAHTSRFMAAITRLHLGQTDAYVAHCRQMQRAFSEDLFSPTSADRIAKSMLLRPQLFDDISTAYELAEIASLADKHPFSDWFHLCRGLSELRQQQPESAVEWCSSAAEDKSNAWLRRTALLIQAMAMHQLSRADAAESLFASASDGWQSDAGSTPDDMDAEWVNRLYFELLLQEASELLGK